MVKVCVLESLQARLLAENNSSCSGALCGLTIDGNIVTVAAIASKTDGNSKDIDLLNEVLPCGMEPIGVFDMKSGASTTSLLTLLKQLPSTVQPEEGDNDVKHEEERRVAFIRQDDQLKAFILEQDNLKDVDIEVITEDSLKEQTVLVRVRGKLDLTCGLTKTEVALGFQHLIEKVTCPYGTYMMEGGQVVFLHKFLEHQIGKGWANQKQFPSQADEDCIVVGPPGIDEVEHLWQYSVPPQQDDGFGNQDGKVKVARRDRLEFEIVWNMTNPACTNRTIGCAPIINYEQKNAKTISIPINIDALGIVDNKSSVKEFLHVLKGCVARQLGDMAASVLSEFSLRNTVSTPKVYHFKPADVGHVISIIYPEASEVDNFKEFRNNMHKNFMLPLDRPFFRKSSALTWKDVGNKKQKLENVHSGILAKHGVPGAVVATVQGNYVYHHYMQDEFNDDGWGCAYRSLQTLVSWLRLQGYTDASVPSHREVQQTLVDIGDKEAKFVGSKQWIGSMEVGFVLETRCGIQSRYISVSSGADMATKAEELIQHFNTEGTPIMVGGGVYAHTILGVAYDEPSEKCCWLILDPHYTGTEDIKTILSKGWCGWKGPNFWNKTAFYNMCLPIKPKNVL